LFCGSLARLLADIDQLDAAIFRGIGLAAVQQLLFAQSDGFYPRRRNAERIDQRIPDRIGPLLAQLEIMLPASLPIGVANDENFEPCRYGE